MKLRKSILVKALIIVFQLGAIFTVYGQDSDISQLSNKQFKKEASKENTVILDVRTPGEYNEGHLKNAILIDYKQTEAFLKQIQALDKSKSYLLYCKAGNRSLKAATIMKENGFLKISDLKEGITGWNGPIVKESQ